MADKKKTRAGSGKLVVLAEKGNLTPAGEKKFSAERKAGGVTKGAGGTKLAKKSTKKSAA